MFVERCKEGERCPHCFRGILEHMGRDFQTEQHEDWCPVCKEVATTPLEREEGEEDWYTVFVNRERLSFPSVEEANDALGAAGGYIFRETSPSGERSGSAKEVGDDG